MELARSSYYYKPRKNRRKAGEDTRIVKRLEELALVYPRYGYRRMTAQLRREGVVVNHKRVLRLMKENGLAVRPRGRSVRTTDSDHQLRIYPNLYRGAYLRGINQAWVADITYVRLNAGFCYLAVVLDAFSRMVVGWALSRRIDAALVCAALRRALEVRRPPAGCIHHSDRGSQYAAADYILLLEESGFRISMSRRGNPYDNAQAESFMKTLKVEEVYLSEYRNLGEAAEGIGAFIDTVYNRQRLHSALGYVPPAEFEVSLLHSDDTTTIHEQMCPA